MKAFASGGLIGVGVVGFVSAVTGTALLEAIAMMLATGIFWAGVWLVANEFKASK